MNFFIFLPFLLLRQHGFLFLLPLVFCVHLLPHPQLPSTCSESTSPISRVPPDKHPLNFSRRRRENRQWGFNIADATNFTQKKKKKQPHTHVKMTFIKVSNRTRFYNPYRLSTAYIEWVEGDFQSRQLIPCWEEMLWPMRIHSASSKDYLVVISPINISCSLSGPL